VSAGGAAALLVLLLIVVAASMQDTTAHPDEPRPMRVRAVGVIRKADMSEESSREVGADANPRTVAPRVVYVPTPAPPPAHAQKQDHVAKATPASPPPAEAPTPAAPPAPPRTDVPPTGGHVPLRPIVTSNPYGGS
jgi:hypothetical protein